MKTITPRFLTASVILIAGCGDAGPVASAPDGPGVAVIYESSPLADVQVRLHASPTGPVIAQGVSAANGTARFAETPTPEPSEYFVSLASLGDGGWILDAKYLEPADSGIKLKPLATTDGQRIEIPRGAVRPLTPNNRR